MTSTIDARQGWNDLLKELVDETGATDPHFAGQRAMHMIADKDAEIARLTAKIEELRHRLRGVSAI